MTSLLSFNSANRSNANCVVRHGVHYRFYAVQCEFNLLKMVKCAVINCSNYEGNKLCSIQLKYFWFPREESLKVLWLEACGRNLNTQQHLKICSEHFSEQDYRLKDILLNTEWSKRRLKPGAVPSLKLPAQDEGVASSTLPENSGRRLNSTVFKNIFTSIISS